MTVHIQQYYLNNNPSKHKQSRQSLLKEHEISSEFRDPFITAGYRRPGCAFWPCFTTLFTIHNETVNIWSHFLGMIFFVAFCVPVFILHNPLQDSFVWPLLAFSAGIVTMLLMSSTAHLFNSMSLKARHICFFLDYAAISTYTFTAGQVFFFYSRPTNSGLFLLQSAPLFLGISALISASSTYFCCASRHTWHNHKFIIRTGTYALTWFFNTLPFLWRIMVCDGVIDCNPSAYRYFIRQFLCFFIAAISNASKIPERFIPGWFNIFGQSHHFMHVLCALGSFDDFLAVKSDMLARREILHANIHAIPSFTNSILLMIAVLGANIAIVVWFAIKCPDEDEKKHDD